MRDFGSKYSKRRPTKDHGQEPATKNNFNRKQENNGIVQHTFDDIILQDNKKLSMEEEAHEKIYSDADKSDLYEIDNMSLDEKKK